MRIVIEGQRGEGKTRIAKVIYSVLSLLGHHTIYKANSREWEEHTIRSLCNNERKITYLIKSSALASREIEIVDTDLDGMSYGDSIISDTPMKVADRIIKLIKDAAAEWEREDD